MYVLVQPLSAWLLALTLKTVAVPTRKHMHYQINKVLPYTMQRYILRKDVELEPLYRFSGE